MNKFVLDDLDTTKCERLTHSSCAQNLRQTGGRYPLLRCVPKKNDPKLTPLATSIPLTLMDLDDLVRAVLERYERMDMDTQRLMPLRKIFWPA